MLYSSNACSIIKHSPLNDVICKNVFMYLCDNRGLYHNYMYRGILLSDWGYLWLPLSYVLFTWDTDLCTNELVPYRCIECMLRPILHHTRLFCVYPDAYYLFSIMITMENNIYLYYKIMPLENQFSFYEIHCMYCIFWLLENPCLIKTYMFKKILSKISITSFDRLFVWN